MGPPAVLWTVCPSPKMLELCALLFPGLVCPLEVSVSSGSIQVARGQTAVLPCTFTTNAALTNLNVIWMVIPLSNANQPQQVGLFLLGHVFPWGFPVPHPILDVGPLQCWVYCCHRTSLSLHGGHALWILHESVFFNVLLTDAHVSLAGCVAGANVCDTVLLSWVSSGFCVQKSTGDVIQVLLHWIWNLEGREVAATVKLWNRCKMSSNT